VKLLPLLSLVFLVLALAPDVAAADGSDQTNTPDVWVRSVVCPVLYTHEITSQAIFRRFLTGLLGAGYQPTTLATVGAAMNGSIDPPARCVVLTFDDALLSQSLNAVPVLTDLNVPAVFFVLPGFADGVHRYMGNADLQALAYAGFDVELHTCNHPNLALLARSNLSAFYAEIQDCRYILESIIGEPVQYLAYPSGAYDQTVVNAVGRLGYRGAFTTQASAVLNYRAPFTLPRIRYDPSEPIGAILARMHAAGG
jgi:peptidoglycan/xylan/chitin deacetylase (PgdA/CDA1 family)